MEQKKGRLIPEKKNEEEDVQHGKEGMDADQNPMKIPDLSGRYNPHMYHDEGGESGESV